MLRISQLKLRPEEGEKALEQAIRKTLHLKKEEAFSFEVLRHSIDARKKPQLYAIWTVQVTPADPQTERKILHARLKNVEAFEPVCYRYAQSMECLENRSRGCLAKSGTGSSPDRPVIIGTGPAGLFCGLLLAREGRRPILIERGQRAYEREKTVRHFWADDVLHPDSNVQFGEGGAGTFSDGKLNTGVKDPEGRIRFILETFVHFGADPGILYEAKPHVGTDVLRHVVSAMTDEICQRGGEVHFETRMDFLSRDAQGIWSICCSPAGKLQEKESGSRYSTRHLVLAIGHSSRDTFRMLKDAGIVMHAKPFAVGVRIQHPQHMIDQALYGIHPGNRLLPSSYKLTHRLNGGRGVYSFCMCPGGYVVNASSEEGCLAINGMSYHNRASGVANSAIVVTISPEEIAHFMGQQEHELIGMEFQRKLERDAFLLAGGAIPVERFSDFAQGTDVDAHTLPDYEPAICGHFQMAGIRGIYPEPIARGIEEGILSWERQIEGFSGENALLCAAESRTSSPVRIERGPDFQAVRCPGLYPCGEGAGYAGGITSAAVDGLKVAEQILRAHGKSAD